MAAPEGPEPPAGSDHPHHVVAEGLVDELHHSRVLTVPNLITLARLLCLPVYLVLLLREDNPVAAGILLAVLGATDFVDGYIARRFDQASNLGRIMDPTVDRLLFFVGIGGILAVGAAPRWVCIAVLVREVLVAGTTVVLTAMGVRPVNVTWVGKAGTFALMFAFPLFLGGSSGESFAPAMQAVAWAFALPGLALSYYSALRYVPEWREGLAERAVAA